MQVNPPLGLSQYSLTTPQGQKALIDWLQQNWQRTGASEDYIAGSRDGIAQLNEEQTEQNGRLDLLEADVSGNAQAIEANSQTNVAQGQAINLNAQAIQSNLDAIGVINTTLTNLNNAISQLQSDLTTLTQRVDALENP